MPYSAIVSERLGSSHSAARSAQPLDVPAGRQRADAQVQDQPAGEQHIQRLAVDEGGDQDEQDSTISTIMPPSSRPDLRW
jgi:hypothetical protein